MIHIRNIGFLLLLYLSDELYLQDLIPGVEQTDDEAFKFLPVGAKFVRADKTKSSGSKLIENLKCISKLKSEHLFNHINFELSTKSYSDSLISRVNVCLKPTNMQTQPQPISYTQYNTHQTI